MKGIRYNNQRFTQKTNSEAYYIKQYCVNVVKEVIKTNMATL